MTLPGPPASWTLACLLVGILAALCPLPSNATQTCRPLGADPAGAPAPFGDLVLRFRHAVAEFPMLAAAVAARDPVLCLAEGPREALGEYDPVANRLSISRAAPDGLKLAILIHEARHVEQFARGFCPANDLAMKENARTVFAMEADASAVSLLIAWDLRARGDPGAWAALAAWPRHADIAARFAVEMTASGDASRATAEAFDQWYRDEERRETYYVASCSDYLLRQEESRALPRYESMAAGFFEHLCRLPGGESYDCREPEDALRR